MAHIPIIHTETKIESQSLGAVDDFCVVCREVRRLGITNYYSIKRTKLLAVLPISSEKTSRDYPVCECPECGSRWESEGAPGVASRRDQRLRLEEKVKSRTTSSEERSELLLEPFLKMASMSRVHRFMGNKDAAGRWGCYGTFAAFFGGAATIAFLSPDHPGELYIATILTIFGLLVGGGLIGTVVAFATRTRRHVRRDLEPRIVRSLKPLGPSKHELTAAVGAFRGLDPKLGKHFDGPRLHDRMRGVVR